jgi:multiple sugar transport system permease protein
MSQKSTTDTERTVSIDDYRGDVPVWRQLSHPTRKKVKQGTHHLLRALVVIGVLFPMYWTIVSALSPRRDLVPDPTLIPSTLTLEHFEAVIYTTEFLTFFVNSVIVMVGVVLLNGVLATFGGYGLARLDMPFKKTFARGVLFGYMFPPILLAIPMYILWRNLGIINSYTGLILAETALTLPFSLWLMWKFFQTVPYSLEESAQMAGASRFRAMVDVALPMAKPGIIAISILAFAISWGQYTMPLILMPDYSNYVLTVGLDAFTERNVIFWGQMMAGVFIAILPGFVFVYFLQRYMLRGFRAGGVG